MTPWWVVKPVRISQFLGPDHLNPLSDEDVAALRDAAVRISMLAGIEHDKRRTERRRERAREARRRQREAS